jgi:hypothetical protein
MGAIVMTKTTTAKTYEKPILVKGPVLTEIAATVKNVTLFRPAEAVCWVARAAFGESDIRWMIFRGWLLDDAPAWFRALYLRHGETVGAWLTGRDGAREVVRRMMAPAIRRKLRG